MKPLFVSEELKVIHLKNPAGLRVQPHSHPYPGNNFILEDSIRLNSEAPVLLHEGNMVHIPADYAVGLDSEAESEVLLISSPSGYRSIDNLYQKLEENNA